MAKTPKKRPTKEAKKAAPSSSPIPIEQTKVKPESFPLFPALEDPEKRKLVNKVIERRNYADYRCYMTQRSMFSEIGCGTELMAVLAGKRSRRDLDDLRNAASIYAEMAFWGKVRENANEIFARAMANLKVSAELLAEFEELKSENKLEEMTEFLTAPYRPVVAAKV